MTSQSPPIQNEDALIGRWEQRQTQLAALLEACGASPTERTIEWVQGKVTWVDKQGTPLAIATMKALCSYSFEDGVLMMAWAQGEGAGAVIAPLPTVPAELPNSEEADAWLWAMYLAQESGADFLYRVSSPPYLVFLGLWNLTPTLSDLHIEKGSADSFVLTILERLRRDIAEKQKNPTELRRLILNQGESLLQNRAVLSPDPRTEELLVRTGRALIDLAASFGHRRFGLLPANALTAEATLLLYSKLDSLKAVWLKKSP
jgi:hypothetical protein